MDSVAGEWPALVKMFAALFFVLGLMGGLSLILKKLGLSGPAVKAGQKSRLSLIESIPLDNRRRLAIIQRDDVQHLVILGPNGETVIETGLPPVNNDSDDS
ncbi:MAG: flagellar biosynthetic protein FliO [Pseudomonadota bacterium]